MKSIISILALTLFTVAVIAPAQAQTTEQLLEQIKSGSLGKSQEAIDLENQFSSAGAGKAALLTTLQGQRAQLEARSETLEAQLDANTEDLSTLRNQYDNELGCLLYTSPSPRDRTRSRMPSSA